MRGGVVTWPPSAIGGGDATNGYWLGDSYFNAALIVAPISTEAAKAWGSQGTARGTTSTTNGLANTNTLYSNGTAAHPAAGYAKTLTTGGYNSWYLPALNEFFALSSQRAAEPFATASGFTGGYYWTSTEYNATNACNQPTFSNYDPTFTSQKSTGSYKVRATRRVNFVTTIGQGSATIGYWLGTAGDGVSKLIVAPKSTEVQRAWGSYGTVRSTTSTTNGVANTTTLFGFGSAAHPAAYYCRALTTGGYNTWYLPAKNELNTLYSNKSAVPFATANAFVGSTYWSSTEANGNYAWYQNFNGGTQYGDSSKNDGFAYVRAVRRA